MRFYKDKVHPDRIIAYMFIKEGILMGIHGENPALIKTRKKYLSMKQYYYGKNV